MLGRQTLWIQEMIAMGTGEIVAPIRHADRQSLALGGKRRALVDLTAVDLARRLARGRVGY